MPVAARHPRHVHGLRASRIILTGSERARASRLRRAWGAELNPEGDLGRAAEVAALVRAQVLLQRVRVAEAALWAEGRIGEAMALGLRHAPRHQRALLKGLRALATTPRNRPSNEAAGEVASPSGKSSCGDLQAVPPRTTEPKPDGSVDAAGSGPASGADPAVGRSVPRRRSRAKSTVAHAGRSRRNSKSNKPLRGGRTSPAAHGRSHRSGPRIAPTGCSSRSWRFSRPSGMTV
jgi:hypothetical protein